MEKIPAAYREIPKHMKLMQLMASRWQKPAHALCRLRAKYERYTAVNSFGKGAPHISLSFLEHPAKEKSDGFILTARTEEELIVWLSDGGFATGESLAQILDLRRQLLAAGGLANEENNPKYKLEVTYLVSHFHIDHVNEGIYYILPNPFIRVKRVYYPQISVYAQDTNHNENCNGDKGIRTRFMLSQKAYQPLAEMVSLPFNDCRTLPFGKGEITLMMPDRDWGMPEHREMIYKLYSHDQMTEERRRDAMPVQVVNSNCVLARMEYAGRSMLLTGDAMKKTFEFDNEPFDRLITQYGDKLRADIVKYPHHGQKRDPAWKVIRDHMLIPGPDAMVVLTGNDGYNQGGKFLTENDVPWMDIREKTLTFTITADGKIHREQGNIHLF